MTVRNPVGRDGVHGQGMGHIFEFLFSAKTYDSGAAVWNPVGHDGTSEVLGHPQLIFCCFSKIVCFSFGYFIANPGRLKILIA
jgi:hypothetical protein